MMPRGDMHWALASDWQQKPKSHGCCQGHSLQSQARPPAKRTHCPRVKLPFFFAEFSVFQYKVND